MGRGDYSLRQAAPASLKEGGRWKEDGLDGEVRTLCREAGYADRAGPSGCQEIPRCARNDREVRQMAGESMRGRTTYERSGGDRPRGMLKGESTWRVEKREATRKGKSGTKGGSPDLNDKEEKHLAGGKARSNAQGNDKEEKHLAGRKAEETAGAERGDYSLRQAGAATSLKEGDRWREAGLDGEVRALCREAGRADGAREVVRRFLALLGMTER